MEYLALILFIFSTSGTPGPNNVMILTSGVNHGVRLSLPHVMGVNVGFTLMIVLVGLGIMQIFTQWPILHQVVQAIGIFYLAYLAFKIATMEVTEQATDKKKPFSFLQAALFQWVNPKAWVMALSALVAFSNTDSAVGQQLFVIAGFYFLFGLPCSFAWLFAGKWLQNLLTKTHYIKAFNRAMAALLICSLYPLVSDMIKVLQT